MSSIVIARDRYGRRSARRASAWTKDYLRRAVTDELPQLVSVLFGHTSLAGPRRAGPDEAARYAGYVRRRLAVKPGLTGLRQVNGRSDLSRYFTEAPEHISLIMLG